MQHTLHAAGGVLRGANAWFSLQPGQENPKVTLWVIDLINPRSIKPRDLKPPNVVKDQLVHSAVWFVWED